MRLIDADALQKLFSQDWFLDILLFQDNKKDMEEKLVNAIDSTPLAYDVENVKKQLVTSSIPEPLIEDGAKIGEIRVLPLPQALRIVKEGGVS